jgi:hypothetical protein
MIHRRLLEA